MKFEDLTPHRSASRTSVLFRLSAVSAVVFIMTVLALVATVFADQQAPATRWLNRNAGRLIAGEVAATLLLGFAAMTQDRRQSLRQRDEAESSATAESQR